jgi:hypothetical protein
VAILNQKWPPKYKNPPIWAKFGFQVDYDVANWYLSFGSHIISYLVVFAPFLTMSPKRSFRRHIVFALFLIKSPNEVWRLIVFAPNINFHWKLFIFEFLTIFNFFYIGGHFENFNNKEHNFEWWSIFVSSFKRIRCTVWIKKKFAPWLPWQRSPFWFFSTPEKLTHTTVDIFTKFHEVWW